MDLGRKVQRQILQSQREGILTPLHLGQELRVLPALVILFQGAKVDDLGATSVVTSGDEYAQTHS